MDDAPKSRSDLGVRTASGVVMMLVAGLAIWVGGWVFGLMVCAIGLGVLWEWTRLVRGFAKGEIQTLIWDVAGILYIGTACLTLARMRGVLGEMGGIYLALIPILGVVGTDIGAYFAGRTLGGPKIAPKISPSKTWSGLVGGMIGAGGCMILVQKMAGLDYTFLYSPSFTMVVGAGFAVVAQAGDFFESWMKRRAGVKDSGRLIPGHGGLFDRVDGLLAVCFVIGIYIWVAIP